MAKQTYKKRINNKKPNNNKANWNESKKENTEKVESITYSDGITVSELAGKLIRIQVILSSYFSCLAR